ncbi:MAG: response regulator [Ignavibacteria bacterium]|nr:response regulator [Ignavibacteria bacterium]
MEGKIVLIVDDSKQIREQIKNMISARFKSLKFYDAENLSEAVKIINTQPPDILILDLALPDGNGLELIEQTKNKLTNTTKIILTNYPYKQFRQRAFELDVEHFFDKSIEMQKILDLLENDFSTKNSGKQFMEEKTKNILVVDDSPTLRKMVIASLKAFPNSIFYEAQNGLEAIEKLALTEIDAVILDLNMPDVQGMEVLKFIKSHELYKNVKVIILTTRTDDESRNEALQLGADLYMTKPFQPNDLLSNLRKVFERT